MKSTDWLNEEIGVSRVAMICLGLVVGINTIGDYLEKKRLMKRLEEDCDARGKLRRHLISKGYSEEEITDIINSDI